MEPLVTSASSPDSLPNRYTIDQLREYIMRSLGYPVWVVEMTPQQVLDKINDALLQYSLRCPKRRYLPIPLVRGKIKYRENEDNGLGVTDVQFFAPTSTPGAIFYANLIDPTPIMRTGLDDLSTFYNWRKTFSRVTGITPDWYWDESENALYIHNPIERYYAACQIDFPYTTTESLPYRGGNWVKRYAIATCRYQYGDILSKYQGMIPGPSQALTLDQGKRAEATSQIQRLEEELFGMQESAPMMID